MNSACSKTPPAPPVSLYSRVLGSVDGLMTSTENRETWSVFACTRGLSSRKVDLRISSAQPDKYKTPLKGLNQQRTVGIPYPYMETRSSTAPRPGRSGPFLSHHKPLSEKKKSFFLVPWWWTADLQVIHAHNRLKDDNSNHEAMTTLTWHTYCLFNDANNNIIYLH